MKRSARIRQKDSTEIPPNPAAVEVQLKKLQPKKEGADFDTTIKINNSDCPESGSSTTSPYFNNKRLSKDFYHQECIELSQNLLGKVIARRLPHGEVLRGTIVETEAYPGTNIDPASHSYRGKITERNKAMFMTPGTSYVYIIHGIYNCFNISAEGEGSVCLIRGVEPLEDYETMHNFRQGHKKKNIDLPGCDTSAAPEKMLKLTHEQSEAPLNRVKKFKTYELAKGPGKLCIAFNIHRDSCDTLDLSTSDELWLEHSEEPRYNQRDSFEIEVSKRVGIESTPVEAREKLWRFFIKNNLCVSTAKPSLIKKALLNV